MVNAKGKVSAYLFRGDQEKIIECALAKISTLVLMPTGMGKSLCYQAPAALGQGLVLVISPLIALMEDQVSKLHEPVLGVHKVKAAALHSAMGADQRERRLQQLAQGKLQLLYVTPERLRKPEFLAALQAMQKHTPIQLLAVDEAHCISQWGADFRPDYSRIGEFREKIGNPPVMALTATATPAVQQDILQQLRIPQAQVFRSSMQRPNLALQVHSVYGRDEKIRSIFALRQQNPGAAIVYFSLIQSLRQVSQELARLGLRHFVYHGDLSPQDRKFNQKSFIEQEDALILATPAFGLGVDKSNVRLLIHAEVCNSLESYYQEFGRAGRDGAPAQCHLLFDPDDVSIQMDFIKWANPDLSFVRKVFQLIADNALQIEQEGMDFLRAQMNFYNSRDYRVETAVNLLERWGCLQKTGNRLGFALPAGVERTGAHRFLDSMIHEVFADASAEAHFSERLRVQNQKLLEMVRLTSLETGCRMSFVLEYFGEPAHACGICDLCVKPVDSVLS